MSAGSASNRRDLALLLLLGLVLFGAGLGLKNPWPPDEPRFALIARDMVESGNWLIPVRAGQLYPDKPPLFLWLQASVYLLTGSLKLSHVLPSLIAALLTLGLVFDLARRLWNRRVAWWAGVMLLGVLQFPMQARSGQIDATLCLFTTLGLYGLCRHLLRGPDWRWCWIGFAAMGLGVITKGVGFLPALVLIPWAWAKGRDWPRLPEVGGWRWALGVLAMLGAIALWLVPMLIATTYSGDPEALAYRDNILLRQTAERYAHSWGHLEPPWYYLTSVIPFLWLPVSLFLPWLLPAWRRRLVRRDARYLLLLGWIVLVVLFFSASPGKRGVYLLPAVPALALAVAPLMPGVWRNRSAQRTGWALLAILSLLFLAVAAAGLVVRPEVVLELEAEHGRLPWLATAVYGALGSALLLLRGRARLTGLLVFFWSGWLILGWWIAPALDPGRSATRLMQRVSSSLGPTGELAMLDWREQMILHADRPVTHFGYHRGRDPGAAESAAAWLREGAGRRLLLPEVAMDPCFEPEPAEEVANAHRRRWLLVDARAVTPACAEATLEGPIYRSREPPGEGPRR